MTNMLLALCGVSLSAAGLAAGTRSPVGFVMSFIGYSLGLVALTRVISVMGCVP